MYLCFQISVVWISRLAGNLAFFASGKSNCYKIDLNKEILFALYFQRHFILQNEYSQRYDYKSLWNRVINQTNVRRRLLDVLSDATSVSNLRATLWKNICETRVRVRPHLVASLTSVAPSLYASSDWKPFTPSPFTRCFAIIHIG